MLQAGARRWAGVNTEGIADRAPRVGELVQHDLTGARSDRDGSDKTGCEQRLPPRRFACAGGIDSVDFSRMDRGAPIARTDRLSAKKEANVVGVQRPRRAIAIG